MQMNAIELLFSLLVTAAAAAVVKATPVTMMSIIGEHQLQMISSTPQLTPTLSDSTHKHGASFSSSSLSLSYFGQTLSSADSVCLSVCLSHVRATCEQVATL